MPTYSQGIIIPGIAGLMWLKRDPGSFGKFRKFQGSLLYGSELWALGHGNPLYLKKHVNYYKF